MLRLRPQDALFAVLGLVLVTLLAFNFGVVVLALLGAFACGAVYVFAGMLPSPTESFGRRLFTSVFLSIVLSSIILIVPGTFGPQALTPEVKQTALVIAGLLPLMAAGFQVIRTPRVIRGILWCLGQR
ncbi:MAG: hypothetical protein WCG92_12220 [Hyphomicrobiales bacterium]